MSLDGKFYGQTPKICLARVDGAVVVLHKYPLIENIRANKCVFRDTNIGAIAKTVAS